MAFLAEALGFSLIRLKIVKLWILCASWAAKSEGNRRRHPRGIILQLLIVISLRSIACFKLHPELSTKLTRSSSSLQVAEDPVSPEFFAVPKNPAPEDVTRSKVRLAQRPV